MAFSPIAFTLPQYEDYPNWWMKAYEQGTTTPLSIATDATGGTLAAKIELNVDGFPVTAGAVRFIPFIQGTYDLWLFPTAAEADANDTTNAIQLADNISSEPGNSSVTSSTGSQLLSEALDQRVVKFDTDAEFIAANVAYGVMVETSGSVSANDGLGAQYRVTLGAVAGANDLTLSNGRVAVRLSKQAEQISQDNTANRFSATDAQSTFNEISTSLKPVNGLSSTAPIVYDMHFDALKGTGYVSGESGGSVSYTNSAASAGDLSISISGTVPVVGQLLVYLGTDGEYYTVVVESVSAPTVNLCSQLLSDIAVDSVFNFYNNESHPNQKGYAAIVDCMLRNTVGTFERIAKITPTAEGTVTFTKVTTVAAGKYSTTNTPGWDVTPAAASSGCKWRHDIKTAGYHIARFKVNSGNSDITLTVSFGSTTITGTYRSNSAAVIEVPFWVPSETPKVVTFSATRSSGLFHVAELEIVKCSGSTRRSLDYGKHVLASDSWGLLDGGVFVRMQERLPNATLVNASVSGNRAGDILARFSSDIAGTDADFVWTIVGTNDYFTGAISSTLFAYQIAQLKQQIQEIGATPVIFTSSVGSTVTDPNRLSLSRDYLDVVPYFDSDSQDVEPVLIPLGNDIAGVGTYAVATLGLYSNSTVTVVESYVNASLIVRDGGTLPAGTTIGTINSGLDGTVREFALTSASRFVDVAYVAPGGGYVTGYIKVLPKY